MTELKSCNPYQQEDEGYLAASDGHPLSRNPYPAGTIRHVEWRRGWQLRSIEREQRNTEGYQAALEQTLDDNPYPRGTIRHDEWRRGWQARRDEVRRILRLGDSGRTAASKPLSPAAGSAAAGSQPDD